MELVLDRVKAGTEWGMRAVDRQTLWQTPWRCYMNGVRIYVQCWRAWIGLPMGTAADEPEW